MEMIDTFQVVHEIAKGAPIHEFKLTLILLLRLFGAIVLLHDPVDLRQIEKEHKLEVVSRILKLHGLESGERHFPLQSIFLCKCYISAVFVEIGLRIDHEVVRENEETALIEEVRIPLDNKGVGLITIICLQVAMCLKELLPVNGQLSLNKIQHTELHRLRILLTHLSV